jgi:hypothetical protein
MPDSNDFQIPSEHGRLTEILSKIVSYQRSLPGGRAVELEELLQQGAVSQSDAEFLASHSVTYKPHSLSDYHAGDMFEMPTEDGGCVFIGPCRPQPTKRRSALRIFQPIVESFLNLPRPSDELLMYIEFTKDDGLGVAPEMIGFALCDASWRQRLPTIRGVAAEFGFQPFEDMEIQGVWQLTFRISPDASRTAAAVTALLSRGCGLRGESEVVYSAGALDALNGTGVPP